jgi:hypothetical protein
MMAQSRGDRNLPAGSVSAVSPVAFRSFGAISNTWPKIGRAKGPSPTKALAKWHFCLGYKMIPRFVLLELPSFLIVLVYRLELACEARRFDLLPVGLSPRGGGR